MRKKGKLILISFAAIGAPLLFSMIYMFQVQNSESSEKSKRSHALALEAFVKANDFYNKLDMEQALLAFQGLENQLIDVEDGCELMISTLAQLEGKEKDLEKVSKSCIAENKAIGIAHEGLAKSLSKQNKIKEAIQILEKEMEKHNEERISAALAHLYLFDNQPKKSAEAYVETLRRSDIWFVWLKKSLRFEKIKNEETYATKAAEVILSKDKIKPEIERSFSTVLKHHKLNELIQKFEKRWSTYIPEKSSSVAP